MFNLSNLYIIIIDVILCNNKLPLPKKWYTNALANNICPDLNIHPHPISEV